MTNRGCEEMLSPWEQPLVDRCHSLQTYLLFTCANHTDFCESCIEPKICTSRHIAGVYPKCLFVHLFVGLFFNKAIL